MELFAHKLEEATYTRDSEQYQVALLEIRKRRGKSYRCALLLWRISNKTLRWINLGSTNKEILAQRYFPRKKGSSDGATDNCAAKLFPRPASDSWKDPPRSMRRRLAKVLLGTEAKWERCYS